MNKSPLETKQSMICVEYLFFIVFIPNVLYTPTKASVSEMLFLLFLVYVKCEKSSSTHWRNDNLTSSLILDEKKSKLSTGSMKILYVCFYFLSCSSFYCKSRSGFEVLEGRTVPVFSTKIQTEIISQYM